MPDTNDHDIDALLVLLREGGWNDFHHVVISLVAERNKAKADFSDAWRERCEFARRIDAAEGAIFGIVAERDSLRAEIAAAYRDRASSKSVLANVIAERDALKQRVAELEEQPPADRDLRERLVESALRGVNVGGLHRSEAELLGKASVWMVDAAIAAMRKGDTNA